MEYCQTNLYKELRQKLFHQSDLRFILVSIADGLSHLHDMNIIHRNLKPESILIQIIKLNDKQTQNIYKLGNFSTAIENGSGMEISGTACYMAPELIKNQKYDKSADVWALGTFAYELLTGEPLFYGQNQEQIYQLIMLQTDESQYIKQKLEIIQNEFKPIILRMLKVTPQLRPDIKEVIRELRQTKNMSPVRFVASQSCFQKQQKHLKNILSNNYCWAKEIEQKNTAIFTKYMKKKYELIPEDEILIQNQIHTPHLVIQISKSPQRGWPPFKPQLGQNISQLKFQPIPEDNILKQNQIHTPHPVQEISKTAQRGSSPFKPQLDSHIGQNITYSSQQKSNLGQEFKLNQFQGNYFQKDLPKEKDKYPTFAPAKS